MIGVRNLVITWHVVLINLYLLRWALLFLSTQVPKDHWSNGQQVHMA